MILEGTLGLDFINDHMIELANYLDEFVQNNMNNFVGIASALGAIFALVVAGIQAYKTMSLQEGKLDILAIARPILFAFVLANWSGVVNLVTAPGRGIENYFRGKYEVEKIKVVELRELNKVAADSLRSQILLKKAAADEARGQKEYGVLDVMEYVSDKVDQVVATVKTWVEVAESYVLGIVQRVVQWIGELYWQVSVYYIFLLKAIYMAAVVIFGPIYMVCSILPAWKDSWSQWVGRTVSISLYGAMAYLVMIFSMQLMKYGIEADTKAIYGVLADEVNIGQYMKDGFGTIILSVLTMFCGAQAMKSVPEMATWAIPGSVIHGAAGFMGGTIGTTHGKMNQVGKSLMTKK